MRGRLHHRARTGRGVRAVGLAPRGHAAVLRRHDDVLRLDHGPARRGTSGTVAWSSETPEVFSVTPGGLVTGLSDGTGTLRATFGGLSDSAVVTVAPVVSQFARQLAHDVQHDDLAGITAAIARDGEVLWSRAFGWADRERQVPAARETIYKVGSIPRRSQRPDGHARGRRHGQPEYSAGGTGARDWGHWRPASRRQSGVADAAARREPHLRTPDVPELPDASIGHVSIWKSKLLASIPTLRYRTRPGTEYHYSNVGYALSGSPWTGPGTRTSWNRCACASSSQWG